MNLKQIYSKLFESYGYFEDNITELDGKYYLDIFYDALVDLQNIVDNAKVEITFAQDFFEDIQDPDDEFITNEHNAI